MIKHILLITLLCLSFFYNCIMYTGNYSGANHNSTIAQDTISNTRDAGERLRIHLGQEEMSALNCLIIFLHDDDIWLIDDDTTAVNLSNTGNIFSFACDPDSTGILFYSILNEAQGLDIFVLKLENPDEPEYIGSVINEAGDMSYFVTSTYGERAQMEVTGNELLVECDFVWGWFDFTDVAVIDLSMIKEEIDTTDVCENNITEEENDIQITNELVGDISELFCTNQGRRYQLSNTQSIVRWEDHLKSEPIRFELSPAGNKVIFSILADFCDLAHGPLLIVNVDGSNQHVLDSDMMLHNLNREWVDDKLLYIRYSQEYEGDCLYIINNYENMSKLVMNNIQQFRVIQ
ncbi:hypothetical protein DRQ25_12960 [Candidatus Fermentibacteria bacterium]|nr:MAG: hypothetical protein DRQ25_12960 [Candidatus Fermentibacteria bacterium]